MEYNVLMMECLYTKTLFTGFRSHTHKPASAMPKPQSFTKNTEENRDILENFTA